MNQRANPQLLCQYFLKKFDTITYISVHCTVHIYAYIDAVNNVHNNLIITLFDNVFQTSNPDLKPSSLVGKFYYAFRHCSLYRSYFESQ